MRLVASIIVIGLLMGCAGAPKHPSWSNATGAEQHERLMWQAVREQDWSNFERALSPTFVGVNAEGQMFDRPGWLAYWRGAKAKESVLGEVSVHPEGTDMKVIYTLSFQNAPGATPAAEIRVVSVWQQVKGRWVLTVTSMTPVRTN